MTEANHTMPAPRTTPQGYAIARKLRKKTTPAERKLWAVLRNDQQGVNFRRQHAVGKYIPDFICIKKKLIIELDGAQHLEQVEYDDARTRFLQTKGYRVIRFWNRDVMNDLSGVLAVIQAAIHSPSHLDKVNL